MKHFVSSLTCVLYLKTFRDVTVHVLHLSKLKVKGKQPMLFGEPATFYFTCISPGSFLFFPRQQNSGKK